MQYVESFMNMMESVPVIGWWAIAPEAIVCGALFWDILSCLILAGCWLLRGRKKVFRDRGHKALFLTFAAGTAVLELSISAYTFLIYNKGFGYTLQDHGYPFLYFMAITLTVISAAFFVCFLIGEIVASVREVKSGD